MARRKETYQAYPCHITSVVTCHLVLKSTKVHVTPGSTGQSESDLRIPGTLVLLSKAQGLWVQKDPDKPGF